MGAMGGSASADAGPGEGGACADPASAVPDIAPFEAPPVGPLGAFQVTFHNRCAKTVWPAWGSSGGLDNSVIDTELWFPMAQASERSVTVYGGLGEIGFWARTGCSFDQSGGGVCQTGECGGFVCPIQVNRFPEGATIFLIHQGFLEGYNVALRVEGAICGSHECVADLRTCAPASAVQDSCGSTIACGNICGSAMGSCCSQAASGCSVVESDGKPPSAGDLVITFCP
jgi:hypothetical protein